MASLLNVFFSFGAPGQLVLQWWSEYIVFFCFKWAAIKSPGLIMSNVQCADGSCRVHPKTTEPIEAGVL